MPTAIYPGTFDPITYGHIDLIERSAKLFEQVIVAVAKADEKQPWLSWKQRIALCRESIAHIEHTHVCGFEGLLVDFTHQKGGAVLVRGVRTAADWAYEAQLAGMNRAMAPAIETLWLAPKADLAPISSSLVRDIAAKRGNIEAFVPEVVSKALCPL